MNFIKWLADILLGWIMYIPNKIKHIKTPLQYINEIIQENSLENKSILDRYYYLIVLIFVLPLLMSESYILHNQLCQEFIHFMASFIPGISVISKASNYPQISALEVSIAWIVTFALIFTSMYEGLYKKTIYVRISKIPSNLFVLAYIGNLIFLIMELSGYFSFYYGNIATKSKRLHSLLQSEIGIAFFSFLYAWWMAILFAGFVLYSFAILKKIGQSEKYIVNENDR